MCCVRKRRAEYEKGKEEAQTETVKRKERSKLEGRNRHDTSAYSSVPGHHVSLARRPSSIAA